MQALLARAEHIAEGRRTGVVLLNQLEHDRAELPVGRGVVERRGLAPLEDVLDRDVLADEEGTGAALGRPDLGRREDVRDEIG